MVSPGLRTPPSAATEPFVPEWEAGCWRRWSRKQLELVHLGLLSCLECGRVETLRTHLCVTEERYGGT